PVLTRTIASRIGAAIPAALSLAKNIDFPTFHSAHCTLEECNSIALRYQSWSSCYVPGTRRATNGKETVDRAIGALAYRAGFWHIRTAMLSHLTDARAGH